MSDQQAPLAKRGLARFEQIEFEGDNLVAVLLEGEGVAVPVRAICQALGLDVQSQSDRLRDHEVLAEGLRLVRVPQGKQLRSVVALLHRYIPFWLATIVPAQVKEVVRPKLVRYQVELVDLLATLYGGELRSTQPVQTDPTTQAIQQQLQETMLELRLLREAMVATQQRTAEQITVHDDRIETIEHLLDDLQQQFSGQTTITAQQQEIIKRSIQRLAKRYKQRTGQEMFARLFGQFCIDLGTPKYSLLPATKYPAALTWLRTKAVELLPDEPDVLPPLQESLL